MRRLIASLAAASLLIGLMAASASAAPGGVERHQATTTTYTTTGGSGHVFTLTLNPCDASVTGTAQAQGGAWTETVTGTVAGGNITFRATYVNSPYDPYYWFGTFPVAGGAITAGGDSWGSTFSGWTMTKGATTSTSYANHGAYVSAMGGGEDAAHSCLGMPITD